MFGNLSGPTLLVILFIVLLLFGAPKLPGLAKSLGQSMRILKKEVRTDAAENVNAEEGATPPSPAAPASPASTTTQPPAPPAVPSPETPRSPSDRTGTPDNRP
ncbi:twin-arginine translocase TatA/TatE family subunit [Leucobacter rhizosphaerae]|uniref:Sec-independent protein translocase protein TatA n=1 Tax=Leucobacter rhizosphaerae TaxID=2932245 RepID=A0ABY4FZI5_9MICO|nr:twin-arginine translocase TatA/TatE family subunit [Leucobacter rhizosphaerae]UOQ61673.1 twin-arginine translocase TatA/TatE family subunit [Leucobacter rhizosphaerae]